MEEILKSFDPILPSVSRGVFLNRATVIGHYPHKNCIDPRVSINLNNIIPTCLSVI